ncbi:MAG: hypothetical protein GX557_00905, partial [Chloroflexi bacterium]|nr:hypothetical protein [Chloroflexota bacterium]
GVYGLGEFSQGVTRAEVQAAADRLVGLDPRRMVPQEFPEIGSLDLQHVAHHYNRWWEAEAAGPTWGCYMAVEMAMFDLLGRYYGVPAHFFLGGAVRDRVPADYWIGIQTPEDAVANTRLALDRGFKGMKLKGAYDECLIDRCEAIWDVAGRDFGLTIDPNCRWWRPAEAIEITKALAARGRIVALEDPMPKWNLDWYRLLRQQRLAPVALHLGNPLDIVNAIKAEAMDYVNTVGGMVQFVRNAAMAHAAGIPCWHGSANEMGLREHSYLHACAAARSCVLGSDLVGSWTREDDLILDPVVFEDGHALVPDRPGLGCELDMDAVENHRVE